MLTIVGFEKQGRLYQTKDKVKVLKKEQKYESLKKMQAIAYGLLLLEHNVKKKRNFDFDLDHK